MVMSPAQHLSHSFRIGTWRSADPGLVKYAKVIRLITLPLLAATICAVIAGVDSTPGNSRITTGYNLRRASSIIFLVCVLVSMFLAYSLFARSRTREQKFDLVLFQTIIVLPIMLMRIIYAIIQSFLSTPTNPGRNTWVYLALLLIPDFVSVLIYTICGFKITRAPVGVSNYYSQQGNVEEGKMRGDQGNVASTSEGAGQAGGFGRRRRQRRRVGPISFLIFTIIDLLKKDDK